MSRMQKDFAGQSNRTVAEQFEMEARTHIYLARHYRLKRLVILIWCKAMKSETAVTSAKPKMIN